MINPVLLMARELDGGGSERQLTEIALGLDRSRFAPCVGTFRPNGLRGEQLRAAGVPVIHFPVQSFRSRGALTGAWQLARFIRSRKIRLVHAFDAPLATFATPVVHYFTAAVMLTSQRGHRNLTPEYHRLLRWTDRLTKGIVVNCEYLKHYLIDEEGVRQSLVHVCRNGIDLEQFHPAPVRPAAVPPTAASSTAVQPPALDPTTVYRDAFVVGAVSMLRPEKDLATLIQAFAQVRGLRPAMKLIVVGSGPQLQRLQHCARDSGVAEDCLWQPATADVVGWLHRFDVFVLSSRSEAFPNSVMEAMACGCAVVASKVGGVPELIQHGATGLLFEPGNPAALAAALRRLLQDPALRSTLASAGERFVRENLSRQASAERMGEIYTAAIQSARG